MPSVGGYQLLNPTIGSTTSSNITDASTPGRGLLTAGTSGTQRNLLGVGGEWEPVDHNIIAWAFDPAAISNTIVPTASGLVYVVALKIPVATTITNVILSLSVAGSGLTAGQCFAGLYQGGTLLAATADQSSAWASAGAKTMPLSSPQAVSAGVVYVACFTNGTTLPTFFRGGFVGLTSYGLGPAYRYATADTGRTTSFAATLGTLTQSQAALWAAVS